MSDLVEQGVKRRALSKRAFEDGTQIPNVAVFLKRTTIQFLQILFATRPSGSFHYDGDDTKSDIQICDQHTVNLETTERRPAIVGVRGPMSWHGLGLGANAFQEENRLKGSSTYTDLIPCSMAFSCFSREGTEAEQLAHIVFNSFKFFSKVLREHGFFHIKSLNMGGESLVVQEGEDDDLYLVPVYVSAQIQDRWTLEPKVAKNLKELVITTMVANP